MLQASIAMLWSLVAAVFLHLTKRYAVGLNLLHSKELQGQMMNNVIPLKRSEEKMTLQQQFEKRASALGYNIRKSESGDYIYKPTGKLWRWYEAGAHSVLEYGDPNFDMTSLNQAYEG